MTIEEIFAQHPTTCCYEEDARYVYPEREKLLIAEITRLESELAEARKERVCEWEEKGDAFELYNTSCGHKLVTVIDYDYCPYCGGRIEE